MTYTTYMICTEPAIRPAAFASSDRTVPDLNDSRFRALRAPHGPIMGRRHIVIVREAVYSPARRHSQRDATRGASLPNREKLESPQNISHFPRFQFQRFPPALKDRVHNFRDVTHICRCPGFFIVAEEE